MAEKCGDEDEDECAAAAIVAAVLAALGGPRGARGRWSGGSDSGVRQWTGWGLAIEHEEGGRKRIAGEQRAQATRLFVESRQGIALGAHPSVWMSGARAHVRRSAAHCLLFLCARATERSTDSSIQVSLLRSCACVCVPCCVCPPCCCCCCWAERGDGTDGRPARQESDGRQTNRHSRTRTRTGPGAGTSRHTQEKGEDGRCDGLVWLARTTVNSRLSHPPSFVAAGTGS
jgi:hypothetical protein